MPDPSVSRNAHRRERAARRRRQQVIWVGGGLGVVLLAVGAVVGATVLTSGGEAPGGGAASPTPNEPIVFPADAPASVAGAEPCVPVRVLSSLENAEMVSALVAGYNAQPRDIGGHCATAAATKDKSGPAAEDVAAGFPDLAEADRPSVWLPDASTWLDLAADEGAKLPDPASVASSDIVLAMPEEMAAAIHWDERAPSWREIFNAARVDDTWAQLGHNEWGAFKLGKTSPIVATSGQAALLASYGAAAGSLAELDPEQLSDEDVVDDVRVQELAVSHYMATPEHFLWHARQSADKGSIADFLSAVIVDEKSVWDYNRGITSRDGVTRVEGTPPAEQLMPIYPSDGFYAADNPAVVLSGSWVGDAERAAAEDFVRFAQTAEGQAIVRSTGYRDLNGELDASIATTGRLEPEPTAHLDFPSAETVIAASASFPEVRKRADVLFLVDVSGSMGDPIATGESKLAAAKEAIQQALDHFTAGDRVGLAGFSAVDAGPVTPGEVAPLTDIAKGRRAFEQALTGLVPIEFTPLYAAVDQFALERSADSDPDRINAIVLLSDGRNETLGDSPVSAEQMIADLQHTHHEAPVLVFTLAYGADADVATLQSISSATGAHYYDATDPTKVGDVLGDLVTSF